MKVRNAATLCDVPLREKKPFDGPKMRTKKWFKIN
jgi:hypothetical protein